MDSSGEEHVSEELVDIWEQMTASDFVRCVGRGEVDLAGRGLSGALDDYFDSWIEQVSHDDFELMVALDYSQSILEQAKIFYADKKFEFALVFYAMWIEHWVNRVLVDGAQRYGLGDRSAKLLLRKLSITEKLEVAWDIFEWGEFPGAELGSLNHIADVRNSFMHYKHLVVPADGDQKDTMKDTCDKAEALIPKLQDFESQLLYDVEHAQDLVELRSAVLEELRARRPSGLPKWE